MRTTILKYIEKNSRVDLGELAVLLGTDEVTVANEIAQMEKEKIICGYHTLIDWDKVGTEKVTALIEVKVTPQRNQGFDRIAERIYNYPEVNALFYRFRLTTLCPRDSSPSFICISNIVFVFLVTR